MFSKLIRVSLFAAAFASTSSASVLAVRNDPKLPACDDSFDPFVSRGCYVGDNLLHMAGNTQFDVDTCTAYCKGNNYRYAGLTYFYQCFCGASITNGQQNALPTAPSTSCNAPCDLTPGQTCGGTGFMSVWEDPTFTDADAKAVASDYTSLGCWTDVVGDTRQRTLDVTQTYSASTNTIESCLDACGAVGYPFAGIEAGNECYCGVTLGPGSTGAPPGECNAPCPAGAGPCGGPSRLSLYVAKNLESNRLCRAPGGDTPVFPTPDPSGNATCGTENGYGCINNSCCGEFGFCGTDSHCLTGCDPAYGRCGSEWYIPPSEQPTYPGTTVPTADPTSPGTTEPTGDTAYPGTTEPTSSPTVPGTTEPTADLTSPGTTEPTGDTAYPGTTEPTGSPTVPGTTEPTGGPIYSPTEPAPGTTEPTGGPIYSPTEPGTLEPTGPGYTAPTPEPTGPLPTAGQPVYEQDPLDDYQENFEESVEGDIFVASEVESGNTFLRITSTDPDSSTSLTLEADVPETVQNGINYLVSLRVRFSSDNGCTVSLVANGDTTITSASSSDNFELPGEWNEISDFWLAEGDPSARVLSIVVECPQLAPARFFRRQSGSGVDLDDFSLAVDPLYVPPTTTPPAGGYDPSSTGPGNTGPTDSAPTGGYDPSSTGPEITGPSISVPTGGYDPSSTGPENTGPSISVPTGGYDPSSTGPENTGPSNSVPTGGYDPSSTTSTGPGNTGPIYSIPTGESTGPSVTEPEIPVTVSTPNSSPEPSPSLGPIYGESVFNGDPLENLAANFDVLSLGDIEAGAVNDPAGAHSGASYVQITSTDPVGASLILNTTLPDTVEEGTRFLVTLWIRSPTLDNGCTVSIEINDVGVATSGPTVPAEWAPISGLYTAEGDPTVRVLEIIITCPAAGPGAMLLKRQALETVILIDDLSMLKDLGYGGPDESLPPTVIVPPPTGPTDVIPSPTGPTDIIPPPSSSPGVPPFSSAPGYGETPSLPSETPGYSVPSTFLTSKRILTKTTTVLTTITQTTTGTRSRRILTMTTTVLTTITSTTTRRPVLATTTTTLGYGN